MENVLSDDLPLIIPRKDEADWPGTMPRRVDVGPRAGTEEYMQQQIDRLATQVGNLATQVATQNGKIDSSIATVATNHKQNRDSIHDLREGQQRYTDALYLGFQKMSDSLEKAITPIKDDVLELKLWRSKTTGYVIGISALAALIFKVVEVGLSKAGLH